MKNIEAIADQIARILKQALADVDAFTPAPYRYFLIGAQHEGAHWIMGFAFKTKHELRLALENGVCFQLHTVVFDAVTRAEHLGTLKSFIVFDFGAAPETDVGQKQLHDKFKRQLNALEQESENTEFVTCGLCEHIVEDHLIMAHVEDEESAPKTGWMICPDKECTCFRTWSHDTTTANA